MSNNLIDEIDLRCPDGVSRAHKTYLSAVCPFLKTVFTGHAETDHDVIILTPDIQLEIISKFLQLIYTGEAYFSDLAMVGEVEKFARKFCGMSVLENLSVNQGSQKIEHHFRADENPALVGLTEKPLEVSNDKEQGIATNLDQLKTEEVSFESEFDWESVFESTDKDITEDATDVIDTQCADPHPTNKPGDQGWIISIDSHDPNPSDSDSSDSNEGWPEDDRGNRPDKPRESKKVQSAGQVQYKQSTHRCELCKLGFSKR